MAVSGQWDFSRIYVKWFPYELPFLLFQFSEHFYRLLYQQYYFQRLSSQALSNSSANSSLPSSSICLTQDYIVRHIGEDKFVELQRAVNTLNMYSEILFLGLSIVVALILGPLSDIVGRKPIIITANVGLVLTGLTQFAVIQFNLPVYCYLVCSIFFGGLGGYGTMMTVLLGAIFDVTPGRGYIIRIGLVEACIAVAKATTSVATNDWIQVTGCDFRPATWLMIVITAIAIITVVVMPETLSKEKREEYKRQENRGFEKVINGLKIYFQPRFIGWKNYWQLYAATIVICLASIGVTPANQILNYFLHNKPLEWPYDKIGIYGVINASGMALSLIVILPILVLLGVPNNCICLIGVLFAAVTNILIANISSSWEMYIVGAIQSLLILAYPTMRSNISSLVGSEKQASAFSIAISLQVLASIISTVAGNEIYEPQVGSRNDAGIVFWFMAGAWSATVPLILLLHVKGTSTQQTNTRQDQSDDNFVTGTYKDYGTNSINTSIQQ